MTHTQSITFKVKLIPNWCSQHVSKCAAYTVCFCFMLHFSQIHSLLESSWQLFADKWTSPIKTMGSCDLWFAWKMSKEVFTAKCRKVPSDIRIVQNNFLPPSCTPAVNMKKHFNSTTCTSLPTILTQTCASALVWQ